MQKIKTTVDIHLYRAKVNIELKQEEIKNETKK